ncbi:hypothetical protein GYH30_052577 [Glycine max]|nr:hypothetical protein GYH30_052577 [Glycine max]
MMGFHFHHFPVPILYALCNILTSQPNMKYASNNQNHGKKSGNQTAKKRKILHKIFKKTKNWSIS